VAFARGRFPAEGRFERFFASALQLSGNVPAFVRDPTHYVVSIEHRHKIAATCYR